MQLSDRVNQWINENLDSNLEHTKVQNEELIEVFKVCENENQQLLLLRGHIFYYCRPNFYKSPHLFSSGFFEPFAYGFDVKLFPNYNLKLSGDELNTFDPNYSENYKNDLLVQVVKYDMELGEWINISTKSIQIRKNVDDKNRVELKNFGLKILSISKDELFDIKSLDDFYMTLNHEITTDVQDYIKLKKLKFH
jgi:hypothetical protein